MLTVDVLNVDLECEFDYQPGEPQTWDDPGCPPEIDLLSVTLDGHEVMEMLNDWSLEKIMDQLEEYTSRDFKREQEEEEAERRADEMRDEQYV